MRKHDSGLMKNYGNHLLSIYYIYAVYHQHTIFHCSLLCSLHIGDNNTPDNNKPDDSSDNEAAIVGIVGIAVGTVLGVLGIIIAVALFTLLLLQYKEKKEKSKP